MNLLDARTPRLAQRGIELVSRDVRLIHHAVVELAVVDQHERVPLDERLGPLAPRGGERDRRVERDEGRRRYETAEDRVVAAVHRVLHGVREDEEEDEVERSELPDLSLAGEAEENEQEDVDDGRAEDDLREDETARKPHGSLDSKEWRYGSANIEVARTVGQRRACHLDNTCYNMYYSTMPSRLQAEIKQSKPFRNREHEAILGLLRTAAILDHATDEELRPFGLTHTQFNVLRILRGAGQDGLCGREIGERMITKVPDVPRLLDRL